MAPEWQLWSCSSASVPHADHDPHADPNVVELPIVDDGAEEVPSDTDTDATRECHDDLYVDEGKLWNTTSDEAKLCSNAASWCFAQMGGTDINVGMVHTHPVLQQ